MAFLDGIIGDIKGIANGVGQKINNSNELSALNARLMEVQNTVNNQCYQLGMNYYMLHKDDPEEQLKSYIASINDGMNMMEKIKQEIVAKQAVINNTSYSANNMNASGPSNQVMAFCPQCGEKLAPNSAFCMKCGNKIERPANTPQMPQMNVTQGMQGMNVSAPQMPQMNMAQGMQGMNANTPQMPGMNMAQGMQGMNASAPQMPASDDKVIDIEEENYNKGPVNKLYSSEAKRPVSESLEKTVFDSKEPLPLEKTSRGNYCPECGTAIMGAIPGCPVCGRQFTENN